MLPLSHADYKPAVIAINSSHRAEPVRVSLGPSALIFALTNLKSLCHNRTNSLRKITVKTESLHFLQPALSPSVKAKSDPRTFVDTIVGSIEASSAKNAALSIRQIYYD